VPTILALGGHPLEPGTPMHRFLLELTGAERPRVLFVPTATGDSDAYIARFHHAFGGAARSSHLRLFAIPPPDIRGLVLDQDLVFVGGGNTANMLAVWALHGLDETLREAWRNGVVLAGTSAGAICWFEAGVTDSFREELDGLDCLGFLPGSSCPHYDGEETRRPAFHRLVRDGFPAGYAADDGCGLLFRDTELAEVVSERDGARAYRVERVGGEVRETPLDARPLA
jgi:peptidase E